MEYRALGNSLALVKQMKRGSQFYISYHFTVLKCIFANFRKMLTKGIGQTCFFFCFVINENTLRNTLGGKELIRAQIKDRV